MSEMSMFELFGISNVIEDKKSAKVAKKEKTSEKKEEKFRLPMTVNIGAFGLYNITEEDCGKAEMTGEEIKRFIASKVKGYPENCTLIEKEGV